MAVRQLVLDAWASLNHKRDMERPSLAQAWVPVEDLRRLTAYKILDAYLENSARHTLPPTTTDKERLEHREYGDAVLLVQRVVAGVLGEDLHIAVEGADEDLPETPRLPDRPEEPGPDASDPERLAFDASARAWDARARQTVIDWEEAWAGQPLLQERQEWLRDWADAELFEQRVWEAEQRIVGFGDGVYVLGWSSRAERPILRVYDPGFYFPVLDDEAEAQGFPTRLHLAWELERDVDGQKKRFVRRLTWDLGPLPEGEQARSYPWSDDPSETTCYLTDATWPWDALGDRRVDDFDRARAEFGLNEDGQTLDRFDLEIDFLPVVHVPNTPASQDHFGRSILAPVLQLVDDLSDSDSDLQAASALAGTPMVAVSGATVPATLEVAPGAAYGLGEKGSMTALDLSASVESLRHVIEDLLDRLSVNAQVPAELLGRVKASEVPSGLALALAFGPFRDLVGILRLVREHKYRILLRFVMRLAQANGALEEGETPDARVVFGSFLPADRAAMVDEVDKLLRAKAISRPTALRMLVAVGFEISDAVEEIAQIEREDIEGAVRFLDATGDDEATRARLGLAGEGPSPEAPPEPPAPPVVELP